MRILNYGVISASTTISLSESCSVSDYIIILSTNSYNTDYTGDFESSHVWAYGDGAYISSKTSSSVTITVSTGITCSYQIIKLS